MLERVAKRIHELTPGKEPWPPPQYTAASFQKKSPMWAMGCVDPKIPSQLRLFLASIPHMKLEKRFSKVP